MDNFREEVAVRRNMGLYNFLYFLSWLLLILSGAIALIGLQAILSMVGTGSFSVMPIVLTLLFGGCCYLLFRNKDTLRTEYEYAFTNGILDVAKVLNNTRRKYLTQLELKNVEACGPVNSPSFQRYLTMPDVKKHNWFVNRDAKLYYFYFVKSAVKHLMVVELSDEMIKLVKGPKSLNFGVWQE